MTNKELKELDKKINSNQIITMQIIGDLHGIKPNIDKTADIIILTGDIFGEKRLSDIWKKYLKTNNKKYLETKKIIELEKLSYENGKKVIKELSITNKPIYFVKGNWDLEYEKAILELNKEGIKTRNIICLDNKYIELGNLILIGIKFIHPPEIFKIKQITNTYELINFIETRTIKKQIQKIIKKNPDKKIILLTHNPPFKTNQDLTKLTNEHVGSIIARKILKEENCIIIISGHIHESYNIEYYNNTLCINAGDYTKPTITLKLDIKKGEIKSIHKNKKKNQEKIELNKIPKIKL